MTNKEKTELAEMVAQLMAEQQAAKAQAKADQQEKILGQAKVIGGKVVESTAAGIGLGVGLLLTLF